MPASGVATSTHASAAVTTASPLDVLTIELDLLPDVPMPDCPPNATLIVIGDFVVLVKLSSQRPQFAPLLMIDGARDPDAAEVDRLRRREAIDAIELQAEAAHHFAVEAQLRFEAASSVYPATREP